MCETAWSAQTTPCLTALEGVAPDSASWFSNLAERHGIWLQAGLLLRNADGSLSNAVVVVDPAGERKALYRKNFLFPSEQGSYKPGDGVVTVSVNGIQVCPLICYDLRFPELWRLAAQAGAEVFAVSSSWPSVRHEHWRALLVARAIENQAVVIAANRTGNDPSLAYLGGSVAIDHLGHRVGECDAEFGSVAIEFDRPAFDGWRAKFSALRDLRTSLLGTTSIERR
jgi:predicted amidohydrolase